MVRESLEVKHVLVQLILYLLIARVLQRLPLLRPLFKQVALVIPPSGLTMLRPITEAEPAKLVAAASALGAAHVVAALVLLNGLSALWALLRIGLDPADVLGLLPVFDVPHANCLTVCGPVCLLTASPAPDEATLTLYFTQASPRALTCKRAAGGVRAPLHSGIVVNICLQHPLLMLFRPLLVAESAEKVEGHSLAAFVLWAPSLNASLAIVHHAVQVSLPACRAKAVAATDCHQFGNGRLEADRASDGCHRGCRGGGGWAEPTSLPHGCLVGKPCVLQP
mmetsp:Transcript_27101/g.56250  ORF Transcript_27101/g.56250 Transcript_27101/m.56250 type:complete len:280 (-) Transcript_27101:438-1277(-)